MAKKTIVEYIDDLDGTTTAVESIKFAIDGVQYEIDLSGKNAGKLRDALAPFIEAGTKVGRVGGVVAAKAVRTGEVAAEYERRRMLNGAVRSWFNGLDQATRRVIYPKLDGAEVSDRGRVPAPVTEAYNDRNVAPVKAAPEAAFVAPEAPAQATNGNGKAPATRPTRTPAKRTTAATVAAAEARPATPRKRTKAAK